MLVKDIMTIDVIAVHPETTISKVASLLFYNNLTGMPVVDEDNKVIGIVTEYDLISPELGLHIPTYIKLLKNVGGVDKDYKDLKKEIEKLAQASVKEVMTRDVITVTPDTTISSLVDIIMEHHINPIPVVDKEGRLVGIVSRADLVKLLKEIPLIEKGE